MPRLRQLPELFLRGALANQTIKSLTDDEKLTVEELVQKIASHPILAPNRTEFIQQLGRTIGGDYREDRTTAEQEYQIAIWKGVIHLLYHCSYSYKCTNCNESTYLTQRNKPSPMNQIYPICPACRHVKIITSQLPDYPVGKFVTHEDFQDLLLHIPKGSGSFTCGSPIIPIRGERKVQSPDEVLKDPIQLKRLFAGFVWNYFRQIIKENKITYHQRMPQQVYGPADQIAILEIIGLLVKMETPYRYCQITEPTDGSYHIYCQTSSPPPEFSVEYNGIVLQYRNHGINITYTDEAFIVPKMASAPMTTAVVIMPTPVLINANQSSIGSGGDDPAEYAVEQLQYTLTEEDPMTSIDNMEVLNTIRDRLPDDDHVKTFDILTNHGDIWDQFSTKYGDKSPRTSQIAEFIGITAKVVTAHKEYIGILCYAYDLVPGNTHIEED